jgi:sigma-E factor negative regulatory protein RseB
MTGTLLRRCSLLVLGLAIPAAEAADPQALLARIQHAAQQLNYDGVFVYQYGDQLESLRILHKVTDDGMRERLVSLNGAPREIIRTVSEVRCYLPDENAVMVEHRRADRRNFPALLPETLAGLSSHYQISTGKGSRVAGRKTESVEIRPRDGYRYGYQLWADQASGLLLRAALLDEQRGLIEQYLFTQVAIGKTISDADLQPENRGRELVWHRAEENSTTATASPWEARRLPPGYVLTTRMQRHLPKRRHPVEHLVYSDGLAVVSVFVEPAGESPRSAVLTGLTQMGAIHAFGRVVDDHQITVVGEVPATTVDMIAESVSRQP